MAKHKLNPVPGELWFHPFTFNTYVIHSITDDGWVRYRNSHGFQSTGFLLTQPTLDFIKVYKRSRDHVGE